MLTIEGLLVCDVVYEQDAHSTPIVCGCDCSEPFLSRGVPDLQFDPLAVEINSPDLEVDADGCDERRCKAIFAEAQQTA